ncbi:swr1 complex component [Friedmanniomyces endolithicus]|uniref:DNA helicase n=1 Tax=Friedmanniomyces endolithicus TaxID=329885 RepID=A0AAN6QKG3_9PEZI|nr:swr1 complex component [Friedmanniomyces endolithicus]KAK0275804.1 swr1 complex component [Friedmanniomyces endolithicus]KAK0307813.1 swr1 complex component [Friedmanniomyces endolithicus]KAK0910874.1 swr1 complex component [Friedmanniomyces endolithicus]KAK0968476.1 swr1 complex component [Friedmanniomyces endolithicus]
MSAQAPESAQQPPRPNNNNEPSRSTTTTSLAQHDEPLLETSHDDHDGSRSTSIPPQYDESSETASTLRPDPYPSTRRRESEAAETVDGEEPTDKPNKKRKRVASPPWQFGTVEATTIKTADGRRVSARFNPNTPAMSESESQGRGRSVSQSMVRSRPPSPPWKRFEAEGPTSLQVDGVRKSGRMNKELTDTPKRTSPRQKKQTEKVKEENKVSVRPISRGKVAQVDGASDTRPQGGASMKRSLSPASRIAELKAQIAALQPTRSFHAPEAEPKPTKAAHMHKRKRSDDAPPLSQRPASPTSNRKSNKVMSTALSPTLTRPSPKIKLRFSGKSKGLVVPDQHPHSVFPPPTNPPSLSIYQVLESYELQELQLPYIENERAPPSANDFRLRDQRLALEEADMRKKIRKAAKRGGVLSEGKSITLEEEIEPQVERWKQYGHGDHLAAHAEYLWTLQKREKDQHRALAKKVAKEAVERWRVMRGPTEDEIQAEEDRVFGLIYKQVVLDIRGKWEMVSAHVGLLRKARWEAEEDARRQERLEIQLEQAADMVAKQRRRGDGSGVDIGEDSSGNESSDGDDESGEENMIDSGSEVGSGLEDDEPTDMPEDDLAGYLLARDAEPLDSVTLDMDEDSAGEDLGEDLGEQTAAAAADDDLQGVRESSANATLSPHPHAPATPATAAATVETRLTTIRDGSADDHSLPTSYRQQRDEVRSQTAARLGSDDEDGEEEQDYYLPDVNGEESYGSVVTDTNSQAGQDTTVSRSRARDLLPGDLDTAEPAVDLSDDESEDMIDSDEDMSSSDDDEELDNEASGSERSDDDEEEEAQSSMLGFLLKKKEIKSALILPTPSTSAGGDEHDHTAEPVFDNNADVQASTAKLEMEHEADIEPDVQAAETTPPIDTEVAGSPQAVDSLTPDFAARSPIAELFSMPGKQMVPVPFLLRGDLRSYQHAGLDWLASLYRSKPIINGILADEMGLGKTIQTISLLAHLAEQYDVWETHLIIVPTSVILNWVNEFRKFLPGFRVLGYYGSAEERTAKRKGWTNDPHHDIKDKRGYNVVITSYQIAAMDISAIRNVQWHYLVLDEAHNIRNFQSQRWRNLIRLKTKARLLLTGTPLQNSLTELWSLLTFLAAGSEESAHGDLQDFITHWKEPVKEIFDRGVSTLSKEAQKVVDNLHISLRPFLLRRLKSEVEKDLPKKTDKRQRQLYQEYMGLASTRESLARGNAVSAGTVLLSLRRVCNHPDLFDPRPIQTSYAMEISPVEPFAVKESLVRKMLGARYDELPNGLMITLRETRKKSGLRRSKQLTATSLLRRQLQELEQIATPELDLGSLAASTVLQRLRRRGRKMQQLRDCIQITEASLCDGPVYGQDLRAMLTVKTGRSYQFSPRARQPNHPSGQMRAWPALGQRPFKYEHLSDWYISQQESSLQRDVQNLDRYAKNLHDTITRFAFCTPVATAPVLAQAITPQTQQLLRASPAYPSTSDFAHEARSRTSIVFPDSRLLIYDSGKLQRLAKLLRELQAKGSRSLIFSQMICTLDILERFLNLLGLPYLRLDGATSLERRMIYSSEFNRPDSKYQCMILSSRAGGVGLNLTGASSVIFYDLDWNPQMDRQCMDRAHRIGQVRDVEVYKMVSEKTVEENILRRATQKSLLDQAVIQEGHFTTEYEIPARRADIEEEELDDDGKQIETAVDRLFSWGEKAANQAIASVEDREDVLAAEAARKEENQDTEDFTGQKGASVGPATPGPGVFLEGEDGDGNGRGHVDGYMVELMETMLKDVPFVPPAVRRVDKHGRDPSHRKRK